MLCMVGFDSYFRLLISASEKRLVWYIDELCERPYFEFMLLKDREAAAIEARRLSMGGDVIP